MSSTAPGTVLRTELDDYLPPNAEGVESIADGGAFINIKVTEGSLDKVYIQKVEFLLSCKHRIHNLTSLIFQVYEAVNKMPGVTVYKKENIPSYFHIQDAYHLHDIVILSDLGW